MNTGDRGVRKKSVYVNRAEDRMEPMELDDDSVGHTPPRPFPPTPIHKVTSPVSHSTPPSSPLLTHTTPGMLAGFSPARVLGSSTPWPSGAAAYSYEQLPFSRSASYHGWQNSNFTSPAPLLRSFSRDRVTSQAAMGSPRGREVMTSHGDSLASMETSDKSDVSEMEVGQNSPTLSPSLDNVRSALSSFSLFKKEPEGGPGSIMDDVRLGGLQEGVKAADNIVSSWEPTLSTVQAAATLKQRKGRKSSPSKAPGSHLKPPGSETQVCDESMEGDTTKSKPNTKNETIISSTTKSQGCSCRLCVGVMSVLLILVAIVYAFALQKYANIRRETFACVDTELLRNEMASKVFGQHIAMDVVADSIEHYLRELREKTHAEEACIIPPLVLSFHGWTGVGKNFVSDIIMGLFSVKTVTRLLVPYHFPHQHLDKQYQSEVEHWILSNVTDYAVNFVILDEMDKATPGVVQGVQSAITKLRQDNSCRSPVVFLLLSNSFATDINKRMFEAMMEGVDRDQLYADHFSPILDFSRDKDLWYSYLRSDIMVTVPFMPLEKQHVIQCIRRDLVSKKLSTRADLVHRVLQELTFTRLPNDVEFSQTGCKRVSDKVDLVAFD